MWLFGSWEVAFDWALGGSCPPLVHFSTWSPDGALLVPSREAKGQMDLQALAALWPLCMVCPDWNPELRQLLGGGVLTLPTKYYSWICFWGVFFCCWLRAQLLISHTEGSSEVAFPSLVHSDPLFQGWDTGWQPKTDGAVLCSACTTARGRQQAHALPSDDTGEGISTWCFCPSIQSGEQPCLGTPVQLVLSSTILLERNNFALKILFIIPVQLSLQQQGAFVLACL